MGPDPLLVWYTQHEPILTPAQRAAILVKARHPPQRRLLNAKASAFWLAITKTQPDTNTTSEV